MEASDIRRIKELEEEKRRLKRMFADLSLENEDLKDVIVKKALAPAEKRELIDFMAEEHGMSVRRSCAALNQWRSVYSYKSAPQTTRL